MRRMRAWVWTPSVIIPTCGPVKEQAGCPRLPRAMASRPMVICSPVASTMSISRGSGVGVMACARATRLSVVLPMAETTTTMRWPWEAPSATRRATLLIFSGSATDEPPYFCTMSWPMRESSYTTLRKTVKKATRTIHERGWRNSASPSPCPLPLRGRGIKDESLSLGEGEGRVRVALFREWARLTRESSARAGAVTLGLLALGPRLSRAETRPVVGPALAGLLAQMLALLGRHLAPPLHVLLEALALLGIHGLIALEAPLDLLLLLRRQLLEALVRRLELALAFRGQAVPPLEVLHDARALARRHIPQALEVLPGRLPLARGEALPVLVVLERPLPLLGRELPPLL